MFTFEIYMVSALCGSIIFFVVGLCLIFVLGKLYQVLEAVYRDLDQIVALWTWRMERDNERLGKGHDLGLDDNQLE